MKLLRYGPKGKEKPGLLDKDGKIRDLSGRIDDVNGAALSPKSLSKLAKINPKKLPLAKGRPRLGPCVGQVGKLVCVGLNYSDHAAEMGLDLPTEPVLFSKATSAICGPNDNVILPKGAKKTDWEVEFGIVIGTEARNVAKSKAMDYVAGYCIVNDVSERSFQLEHGGQWMKGKSADTFAPLGPWMVTKDEVPKPGKLKIWLEVDGQRYQDGSTKTMIFGVANLVHYISQFMSLQPGDVISTGTPAGVGVGHKPPVFLKAGQIMRLGIDGLGEQKQKLVPWKRR